LGTRARGYSPPALLPLKDNIPTRSFPVVTIVIIAINIAVFIFFQQALFGPHGGFSSSGDPEVSVKYTFIPYELSHPGKLCGDDAIVDGQRESVPGLPLCEGATQTVSTTEGETTVHVERVLDRDQPPVWATIFTAMFMHGGVLHIAGNMLFLWIFGNNVEDAMGKVKYILFYLAGGVAAALAQFFIGGPNAPVPMLGASGAIAAVLGGYALLYPRARVVTLVFIVFFITVITLPALLVLGLWFLLQLLDASNQPLTGGGVAVWAHIGGFAFGVLTVKLLATRYDPNYDRQSRLPVY
jgi:membrane associated rhomboid family serine protease